MNTRKQEVNKFLNKVKSCAVGGEDEVQLSGTQLTILGSGFSPTLRLTIDGVSVTPNVVGTTSLTATVPALPTGSHAIMVTDVGGRTYTLGNAFTTP